MVHELAGGVESREGTFGVDWTGRDAVESHSVAAPLDGQGLVERLYTGFCASRRDNEPRTSFGVVGGDCKEDAGFLSGDRSLAGFESDIDRALKKKWCFSDSAMLSFTLSTISITEEKALVESRSVGEIKLPAALLITMSGTLDWSTMDCTASFKIAS